MGREAVTIALAFADRLNRFRALTGEEVDMLVALSRTDTQARARRHWSPEEDQRLRRLASKRGALWVDIGAALGCSPDAARYRMKRLRRQDRLKGGDHREGSRA